MFIRVALLLLLANLVLIDSLKVQKVLKDIGKRFSQLDKVIKSKKTQYTVQNSEFLGLYLNSENAYELYSEASVLDIKARTSRQVRNSFIEASSTQNYRFQDALVYIEGIMLSNFTAEVYQYIKYLTHSASQHKGWYLKAIPLGFDETDKHTLKFKLDLLLKDKLDVDVNLEFEFTMKTKFSVYTNRFFYLASIVQGGTCADKGIVGHTNSEFQGIDSWIENVEGLKKKPTTKLFLKLFTPAVYQYLEENPNKLPRYWLSGINSTLTKINVCHEKVTEPVEYTEDQFRSWYAQFGLMWHPKEGFENQTYSLQLIELLDDSITAKITMKLQMGRDKDAELHDWDFKMLAKKKYQIDEETAIDLPAADTAIFRFKTVSQAADSTDEEKVETEHEWSFDIKWDQMDQFYYIEKMGIGCAKPWTVKGVFKSIVDAIGKKK
ncbi:hypothetical protein GCK72_006828 [Caenorhabditis remanei]|uniref:NTF2-like domain-containing protein n=1 Tax=Caenorhabditis remanei TaxID=31234 RepID=A0A6A5HFY8_CAERE|nr:hypothetical protein GCK72_006828 [Caenorhabditis remanei]KAF1766870.1 hypothetical protein GCK72_006828 [Caenorhabditis remanei]